MCGIAGYFALDIERANKFDIDRAITFLARRGPDDRGVETYSCEGRQVVFAHTRLSIIDLTSGGHQPIHSTDKRLSMVFNGEIYNFKELRQELGDLGISFRTQSDSEVLLAAWAQWGVKCLQRLVGMFAVVVLDRNRQSLTFIRDGFGIKPLYIARTENGVCFASELPAILALRGVRSELNLQVAYDYLVHGDYDGHESTFVQSVEQVAPGTMLELDLQSGRWDTPLRWWTPSVIETTGISFAQATERLRDLFLESVRLHLRSDVPLGTALSGGIDSSAVVCAMRHVEPKAPIHTFSFIAEGSSISEEHWIKMVNSHVGAIPHSVVVHPQELANDIDDMILSQGEPFGSTSIYAQYRVFKLAREHGVKVTLDGQGADELLAGYQGYPGKRIHSLLDGGNFFSAIKFLGNWAKWPDRSLALGTKLAVAEYLDGPMYQTLRTFAGGCTKPDWLDVSQLIECGVVIGFPRVVPNNNPSGRRLMAELAFSATRRGLPALLRHADRNSMRFSVESRVPFLNGPMAEFLLSLPEEYLISKSGETKHVFRAAMRGIVPDAILDRRDKIGFSTPEKDWLLHLALQAREWLKEDLGLGFLRQDRIISEFDAIIAGTVPFSWQAWRWINFSRWYSRVFLPLSMP